MSNAPYYHDLSPISAGLRAVCPRCGRGKLFAGYLDLAKSCSSCRLSYEFADAGDGAAWFVMLVAGVLAVGSTLFVEVNWQPSYWVHAMVAVPLAVGVPLIMLRPVKAMLIAQQYRTRAAEGRFGEDK